MLANLNGIIQDPKRLRVTIMLGPEQLDYICVRFAERVAERDPCRLFWDDDLRVFDPGTRSRLYIRHTLLILLHRKEASTETVLGVFFGMERGTVNGYLKVVNGVLAEILTIARNLAEIIRGVYGGDGGAKGGAAGPWMAPPFQTRSSTTVLTAAGPVPERPNTVLPVRAAGPPS